jgi:hypothetical protein
MIIKRLTGILLVVVLGGVTWLLAEQVLVSSPPVQDDEMLASEPAADAGDGEPLPAQPEVDLPALADMKEIVARPIFSASRRPVEAQVEAPKAAPAAKLEVELIGIVIWQGQRIALIRPARSQEVAAIDEGGTVDGWSAVDIGPEYVQFRNGDAERKLELKFRTEAAGR